MTVRPDAPAAALRPPPGDAFAAYRAAVGRVATRMGDHGPADGDLRRHAAGEVDLGPVLDARPGGTAGVLAAVEERARDFRPTSRAGARTPAELARLLLLQQIDVLWWSGRTSFADDAAVRASPGLTSLPVLRRAGRLGFRYRVDTAAWPARARNYAVRRWAPDREPHTSGLSYDLARPALIALLNEVAARYADATPGGAGGLWVNCLVRSDAVQQRLRDLGYSAAAGSAHCTGWAADVEMAWPERRGTVAVLRAVLLDLQEVGAVNLIDEGQAWHLCLNPAWAAHYEDRFARATDTDGGRPCAG